MSANDGGSGPKIAPDLERFVNHPQHGLTDEQVILLTKVIESGPTAAHELLIWLTERYNNMPDRKIKAQHATDLYFSEEAYNRYERSYKEAQQQGLIPTDGELRALDRAKKRGPNNPAKS